MDSIIRLGKRLPVLIELQMMPEIDTLRTDSDAALAVELRFLAAARTCGFTKGTDVNC